jgi:uncharacterized membrane protein
MRRERAVQGQAPGFSVLLKRNCSISPLGLARVFALIATVTLGIAVAWACFGAWLVLPFAGLEVAALAIAFLACGRHAADYERIELAAGRLVVERGEAQRIERHVLDPRLARVGLVREGAAARVLLCAPGAELEVGRHLDAAHRVEFAAELAKWLRI